MKYKYELGIMGNITLLFDERNKMNNDIYNNKVESDNVADKLKPVIDAMRTERIPSDKIGEDWLITYLADVELSREYVPSLTPPTDEDGSYLHPFTYTVGMEVTEGMWYTDGEDIWEAIANGTPVDFTDREFFDIIEV